MSAKWDDRFLALAGHVGGWSKDPSTQVGCVVIDNDRKVLGTGYNGLPRGIADDRRLEDRDTKLRMIIHAEMNALHNCNGSVKGSTMYVWPFPPCERCAASIIQAGITRVIAPALFKPSWIESFKFASDLFDEAGVRAFVKVQPGYYRKLSSALQDAAIPAASVAA